MKGVVANLIAGTHGVNRLARCRKGLTVNITVSRSSGCSTFFRIVIGRSQMRDEFLPDRFGDRGSIVFKSRQARA